jgi:hypothetical protein
MPPEARAKAAEAAKHAHFTRMAFLSAKARRARKANQLIYQVEAKVGGATWRESKS